MNITHIENEYIEKVFIKHKSVEAMFISTRHHDNETGTMKMVDVPLCFNSKDDAKRYMRENIKEELHDKFEMVTLNTAVLPKGAALVTYDNEKMDIIDIEKSDEPKFIITSKNYADMQLSITRYTNKFGVMTIKAVCFNSEDDAKRYLEESVDKTQTLGELIIKQIDSISIFPKGVALVTYQ